jgi:hypothetical protein
VSKPPPIYFQINGGAGTAREGGVFIFGTLALHRQLHPPCHRRHPAQSTRADTSTLEDVAALERTIAA